MPGHIYTIEELMLDDSFVDYCLSKGTAIPSRWRTIIRENPGQGKTFEEAKRLVLALHGGLSRPEINRQIEIVRRQIEGRKVGKEESMDEDGPALSTSFVITSKGRIKRRLLKTFVYSVVAVSVVIAGVLWLFVTGPAGDAPRPVSQSTPSQEYRSPLGDRKKINLPDGSLVILNSNSNISISFTDQKREVRLKGDAFFRVAKDPAKPFTVYSNNIAATALGTEFYMRGHGDSMEVDLLEGKLRVVNIANNGTVKEIILNSGERGKYAGDQLLKQSSFDTLYLKSWLAGNMNFKNTPLQKVIHQLESWYGVQIELSRMDLKSKPITARFTDDSLQDVLKIICFSTNSQYVIEHEKVIIQ
jgi:ferric-dicitrate binding protein FerR (iron transport regulator)